MLQTVAPTAPSPSGAHTALRILVMMTALSLLPAIVLTMTCFTRIIIVFSFLRQSLGIQGMPPNQVMMGMALFLTAFIMAPVGERMYTEAFEPLAEERISVETALERAKQPIAEFMLAHTSDDDLRLFYDVSNRPRPKTRAEVSMLVLVPAFTLSEVRIAFQMGFLVLMPFLVVDLVVSSVLMAMGMMMLPPTLIALPFKVMIFVLADGWGLVVSALVKSFHP
ncbi:MAG: flagellar type III secretion system pore protein FliP [Myxococcales bacterium FL481]|nr:MAG: flagellar type III secretion system pore protein FliP [Myxococcales bacterium FL481]